MTVLVEHQPYLEHVTKQQQFYSITTMRFVCFIICALLFSTNLTAEHTHSHGHSHSHDHTPTSERVPRPNVPPIKLTQNEIWFQSLIATAFIGVAPILILFFIPLVKYLMF